VTRICGIKFGHDGSVAVIEDGRLAFSIELEKLDNAMRHCPLVNMETVFQVLAGADLAREDVDHFVIDGWHAHSHNMFEWGQLRLHFPRAAYIQTPLSSDLLTPLSAKQSTLEYRSWPHYAGHALGAWCSSPFARDARSSYLLSWDGGMVPYLYYMDAGSGRIRNIGALFPIVGDLYAEARPVRGEPVAVGDAGHAREDHGLRGVRHRTRGADRPVPTLLLAPAGR
jgi:carbamoyltransferase